MSDNDTIVGGLDAIGRAHAETERAIYGGLDSGRVSFEPRYEPRRLSIVVRLDGVEVGTVCPIAGWPKELVRALESGVLKMTDFLAASGSLASRERSLLGLAAEREAERQKGGGG